MTSRSYNCIHVPTVSDAHWSSLQHDGVGYVIRTTELLLCYLTTISVSLLYMMSQVDTLTVNYITVHMPLTQLYMNSTQQLKNFT